MNKKPAKKNPSIVRFYVDTFFFVLMILVLIPQSTGIPIHEWASFLIILPFLVHLIINWNWIAVNSNKLIEKQIKKKLFDYVLNWLLYLLMIIVTISGIVISEAALPVFGIHFEPDNFWSVIHNVSATLLMAVLGIHIALHWKWIVSVYKNLKIKADLHNLTQLKVIIANYYRQLLLIILVSTLLSLLFWILNYSQWAEGFRVNTEATSENSDRFPSSWLLYILPLLKVTIIMTIPALITGAIIWFKKKFNK